MTPLGASASPIFRRLEEPPLPPAGERMVWSFRGDPNFTESSLPAAAQPHHERLLAYIENMENKNDLMGSGGAVGVRGYAQEGDLYQLARPVRTIVSQLALALRATGNLAFLDAMGVILDDMKSALAPGWRGTEAIPGGAPGGDGYIEPGQWPDGIWVFQQSGAAVETGRDVHLTDDQKAHCNVAYYAVACRANADLGAKYAADATYWRDQLISFEKKWRSDEWLRKDTNGVLFRRGGFHSTHGEMLLYELLSLYHRLGITDENDILTTSVTTPPYTLSDPTQLEYDQHGEAYYRGLRNSLLADIWAVDMHLTPTPVGDAYVWSKSIFTIAPEDEIYLHPVTYARYVFEDAIHLYLNGIQTYADVNVLIRMARALAEFVIQTPNDGSSTVITAQDIGGGVTRDGIPPADPDDWGGLTNLRWSAWSAMPSMERWDATGALAAFNSAVYANMGWGDDARGINIPVAKLIANV